MPEATPMFGGIYLVVADMAAAVAFYRRLGLALPDGAEGQPHVTASLGGGGGGGGDGARAGGPTLALGTRELTLGYNPDGRLAPFDAFWGSRYAEVADPDGNVVGFHSPRDPSKGGPPPL